VDRQRKPFVMLLVPAALILFAAFLAAQGPPNLCVNACWQTYTDAVKVCHGDGACLAAARAEAEHCIQGCHLTPPR
jgi:hypothetical protein